MTSIASDVDPSVEKVIRRCLDPDPAKRPKTPLSVAASLPGGDPLAEALAAGEMPSPELVAASGKVEGLDRKYSIPLLVVAIGCLLASIPIRMQTTAILHAPLDIPPDALQHKAREIASTFGYTSKPADTAIWIEKRSRVISGMAKLPEPRKWDEWLASESPIYAAVRESPTLMVAQPDGIVGEQNPPPVNAGMLQINVEGGGRLNRFEAVPRADEGVASVPPETVFQAAGLDFSKFTEKTPDYYERFTHDQMRAWIGPHPVLPGVNVDMQIAWWKGRVTLARVDLKFPGGSSTGSNTDQPWYLQLFIVTALAVGTFFAFLLARKNWKNNRCDRKGALRLAWLTLILRSVDWASKVHAVPAEDSIGLFFGAAGEWLIQALVVWILYIALEPAVRARWPHSLVSWTRALADKWGDPQVGSHVLIGAVMGCTIWTAVTLIDTALTPPNTLDAGMNLWAAEGTRHWIGANSTQFAAALFIGLVGFFTIFGFRQMLRNDIAAAVAASLLFTITRPGIFHEEHLLIMLCVWIALYASLIFTLLRFGLVATIASVFFINSYQYITIGTEHTGWTTASGLATLTLLIGIAVFAFWKSLGTRELIGNEETGG
jgi:hypothetical protein